MRARAIKEIVVAASFGAALFVGLASGMSAQAQETAATSGGNAAVNGVRPPSVTVAQAQKITFVENILVSGSLVPRDEILVGPEIDGYRITELLVEEGDRVKAKQVLARLSKETLQAQLAQNAASLAKATAAIGQSRSQIAEAEATVVQAREAFDRIKPLRKSGAASQATYEEREAAFRTASARLKAAKDGLELTQADKNLIEAQRRELEVKLGFTDIRTPTAGLVSRRNARVGAVSSSASEALFRIIKNGEVELSAEVPEVHLHKLKEGQKAEVEVAGADDRIGTVRLISPEVDTDTRLGRVRIFLGDDPVLRVGSFAKGFINAGSRDAIGVPGTAVLYGNDRATVFVVQNDTVREREVKTGLVSGTEVEVRSGLKEGEIVVERAGTLLRDGELITPVYQDRKVSEALQ